MTCDNLFRAPDNPLIWYFSLDNNDLLRRLRYALRCDDALTVKLIELGGGKATIAQAGGWRAKESDPDYAVCTADTVTRFLDGLILDKRGPREPALSSPWPDKSKQRKAAGENSESKPSEEKSATPEKAVQMDNNLVLKQLRIALSLRSDDVHAILKAGGSSMSSSEASALFRKPDARNFRQCGDQVLRQFIAGLVQQRQNEEKGKP